MHHRLGLRNRDSDFAFSVRSASGSDIASI